MFKNQKIFVRHIALPQDHGSWVFLISPLLIGIFAGGRWLAATFLLIIAALAVFLVRQPVAIAVKAYSGRRSRGDLPAARFWMIIYSLIGLLALSGLCAQGFSYLLFLALPGVPVFVWHLYLVSKRAERRQVGIEIVASGVLALAAPAGYWVGQGAPGATGWWLFVLTWLQSAASIVYAYLRLQQRGLKDLPNLSGRLRLGGRALAYTAFNLILSILLAASKTVSFWLIIPYGLQFCETVWGTLNPAINVKPTRIGLRQLIVSTLFTILFIIAWSG
ncbi:YwiC-like family protein [Chloroflexota bacterium]